MAFTNSDFTHWQAFTNSTFTDCPMSAPSIGICSCVEASACQVKVLVAVITCYGYTGAGGTSNPQTPPGSLPNNYSYCPGLWTITGEPENCFPTTTCSGLSNIVAWIASQWSAFQNDTIYPWNTYTTGYFQDGNASSPYIITGPGGAGPFGAAAYGSTYASTGQSGVACSGVSAGPLCGFAQVAAFKMNGDVFITPLNVPDITEPCLDTAGAGCFGEGIYYIPMPPLDICSDPPEGEGIQIAYTPGETGNSGGCMPAYSGGAYTTCQTPDPFYGDDPP
jgi:hypothetical protein